jgi:hypothetical protein
VVVIASCVSGIDRHASGADGEVSSVDGDTWCEFGVETGTPNPEPKSGYLAYPLIAPSLAFHISDGTGENSTQRYRVVSIQNEQEVFTGIDNLVFNGFARPGVATQCCAIISQHDGQRLFVASHLSLVSDPEHESTTFPFGRYDSAVRETTRQRSRTFIRPAEADLHRTQGVKHCHQTMIHS